MKKNEYQKMPGGELYDAGDTELIQMRIQIYIAYHPVIAEERIKGPELASPVIIGDNV